MDSGSKIDFYSNEFDEKNWRCFAQYFNEVEIPNDIIGKMPNDVVYALVGLLGFEGMKKWITTELKQLDCNTALTLATTDKGIKALKALIMRMPN